MIRAKFRPIFYFIPIFILIITVFLAFLDASPGEKERQWLRFAVNILLLNSLHTLLTFLFLWKIPEGRAWAKERFGAKPIFPLVGLFVFFAALVAYGGGGLPVDSESRRWVALFIAVVALVVPVFHTVWQTMGLSLALGRSGTGLSAWEKLEKVLFPSLFVFSVLGLWLRFGLPLPFVVESQWWNPQFEYSYIFAGASTLCVLGIFLAAFKKPMPREQRQEKLLYLARLPLFVLVSITPYGLIAINAVHGVEYIFVIDKMLSKSEEKNTSSFWRWWLGLSVVFTFGVVPVYFADFYADGLNPVIHVLAGVSFACTYLHILLDRFLFRFREDSARRFIGPLLSR
jgi:hypothetical protein